MDVLLKVFAPVQLIEAAALLLAVGIAFLAPRAGARAFGAIEARLRPWAERPVLSVLSVAALVLLLRAAAHPWIGTPPVTWPDEASILLQAKTYLAGRLASPPLAPTASFESVYVLLSPAHASMYPPGRSLPLVLGGLVGQPWFGALLAMAALAGAVVWMLRAWVSPTLALLVGLLVALRFGVFSYLVNSYYGPTITMLGGVLLMGAYARLRGRPSLWAGCALGVGVFLLMTTRPFEGLLFSLPFGVALLVRWARAAGERLALLRAYAPAALLVALGLGIIGAHNQAVTGDWREMPYSTYRDAHGAVPAFILAAAPEPRVSALPALNNFAVAEARSYHEGRKLSRLPGNVRYRAYVYWSFYIGLALTIPFLLGVASFRREPVVLGAAVLMAIGLANLTWHHAHYAAPAFGLIVLAFAQGFRSLSSWRAQGNGTGLALSRWLSAPVLATFVAAFFAFAAPGWARGPTTLVWTFGRSPHEQVEAYLARLRGAHLVLADMSARAPIFALPVYNAPEPAKAAVVWANDLPDLNPQVLQLYPGRSVWRLGWTDDQKPCLRPMTASEAAPCAPLPAAR